MIFLILCVLLDLIFFFNDTATTEIYTLSLHDALPILATKYDCPRPGNSRLLTRAPRPRHSPQSPAIARSATTCGWPLPSSSRGSDRRDDPGNRRVGRLVVPAG